MTEITVFKEANEIGPGDKFYVKEKGNREGRDFVILAKEVDETVCGTCGKTIETSQLEAHLKEKHFG